MISVLVASIFLLLPTQLALAEPPDASGPVIRFTDAFPVFYADADDGLLALGGPPPEQGCLGLGFDHPAEFMIVQTGSGPRTWVVRQTDLPIFVYDLTQGHPCEILAAGGTPVALYVGTVRSVDADNDLGATLTRTNAFGTASSGSVWDSDGNWCHFSGHVRLQWTRDGEFRILTEDITVAC